VAHLEGHLVYFFSTLPHPSEVSFTTYTLITRHQQPVLQPQSFVAYPRSIALFENFKNFIKTRQTSPNVTAETPIPSVAINTKGLNDKAALFKEWLDDDEGDQLDDDLLLTGLQVSFSKCSRDREMACFSLTRP
jgi:hypothetical protein